MQRHRTPALIGTKQTARTLWCACCRRRLPLDRFPVLTDEPMPLRFLLRYGYGSPGYCIACRSDDHTAEYFAAVGDEYERRNIAIRVRLACETERRGSKARRERERAAGKKITAAEWRDLKTRWGHMCLACGKTEPDVVLHKDHVIPLSMGGTNDVSNIQPLCGPCNLTKLDKTTDWSYPALVDRFILGYLTFDCPPPFVCHW